MLDVLEVTTDQGLEGLRDVWDPLLQENGPHDLQMTHGWIRLWWSCYGDGRELLVLTVRRSSEIVAIAPLMISRSKIDGVRELTFIGQDPLDYSDFMIRGQRPAALEAIFRHLFGRWSWDRMELYELREDSPNLPAIAAVVAGLRGKAVPSVCTECPYVAVEGDWATYYGRLSRKLRADVRRRQKKLERLGRVWFSRIQRDGPELPRTLEAIRGVNRAHFAARGLQHLDKSEAKIRYIGGLTAFLADIGALDVAALWLDDRLIAYNLGYRYRGTVNYWNTGFEPELSEYSPGKLLVRHLIESSFDQRASEVNLLRGTEPYKFEWTALSRKNYSVQIVPA